MKILCLGDSYTIGEGVPAEDSWPHQLVHALRKRDAPVASPEIIAQTGWTTEELKDALKAQDLSPPYDLVTLMIGVNDQYRGFDLERYTRGFESLLAQALKLADQRPKRVFVLSIPDWSVTPYAKKETPDRDPAQIAADIKAFNAVAARLCYAQGIPYIHVTEMSRDARRGDLYLSEDGLHYSRKMYSHWVEHLFPRVFNTLFPGRAIHIPLLYQETEAHHENSDA